YEGILRNVDVGRLVDRYWFETERSLACSFEGCLYVKRTVGVAVGMNEERGPRVATFHGKQPAIVLGKRVRGIDADFAAREPIRCIERQEFHGSAAVGGDLHLFGFE